MGRKKDDRPLDDSERAEVDELLAKWSRITNRRAKLQAMIAEADAALDPAAAQQWSEARGGTDPETYMRFWRSRRARYEQALNELERRVLQCSGNRKTLEDAAADGDLGVFVDPGNLDDAKASAMAEAVWALDEQSRVAFHHAAAAASDLAFAAGAATELDVERVRAELLRAHSEPEPGTDKRPGRQRAAAIALNRLTDVGQTGLEAAHRKRKTAAG